VPLVAPGTEFLPRLRQLDMSVSKRFDLGSYRFEGQVDIFNVFNYNTYTQVRSTRYDTAAYGRPASVLQGRMIRLGVQVKW
jgi:hypothetical protein